MVAFRPLRSWASLWLSGGGLGFLPVAPATWGSLLGLFLAMGESLLPLWGRIGILLLVFGLTWHAFRKVGPLYVTDPPWIVADEIVALLLLAGLYPLHSAQEIGIAFVAFRFWDIAKLWPANEAEKLPGLWGILADDAVAAGYTLLCLWLLA